MPVNRVRGHSVRPDSPSVRPGHRRMASTSVILPCSIWETRACDAHQGSNLRLGKPGVLPQLRELIAALPGAHLRPAPLPLCDAAGTIPTGSKLPTYRLASSQRTAFITAPSRGSLVGTTHSVPPRAGSLPCTTRSRGAQAAGLRWLVRRWPARPCLLRRGQPAHAPGRRTSRRGHRGRLLRSGERAGSDPRVAFDFTGGRHGVGDAAGLANAEPDVASRGVRARHITHRLLVGQMAKPDRPGV
jgi:hypothetical protein